MIKSIYNYVTGIVNLRGGTNNAIIGNTGDRLRTEIHLPSTYLRGTFGGLRTVSTQNVFESLFTFNKQALIWDEVLTGGATSALNTNTKSIDMTVPTTSGASVTRQTFRRIRYNPSRTVQVLSAAVLGAPKVNVKRQVGQNDDTNGLFFELDGLTANCVRRTSTSGSVVDVKYPQSSWNIDKFDGTGPSGLTIDFTKHNLYYVQYAFQGFGDIVWGFYLNGQISFCHRETTGNILSVPFMSFAHLPCRVRIENTGVTASSTTMSYNSCAVKNEGEDAEIEGQVLSYSDGPQVNVNQVPVPVISVRLGPGFEKAIADLLAVNIFATTADEVIWSLWIGATLTGATFGVTASYTQLDIAATAMTGGTQLLSGIVAQNTGSADISQKLLEQVNSLIGSNIAGASQVITLAAKSRATQATVSSTLTWREYP